MEKMEVTKLAYASPRLFVFTVYEKDVLTASGDEETDTPLDVDIQWNPLWQW